jgi:hypothetical protein
LTQDTLCHLLLEDWNHVVIVNQHFMLIDVVAEAEVPRIEDRRSWFGSRVTSDQSTAGPVILPKGAA